MYRRSTGRNVAAEQSVCAPTPVMSTAKAEAEVDLGALFDAHAAFLLRVVERLIGSSDAAEDIVQRVFLTAHQKRHQLRDEGQLRGWLYRVATNEVRHHRRSFARRKRLSDALQSQPQNASETPDQRLEDMEHGAQIRACIAKLPLKQREVFVLYELEELRGTDIAEMLGTSENTIWSRLRLARGRFKELWLREQKKEAQ